MEKRFENYRLLGPKRIFPEPPDKTIGDSTRDCSHKIWRRFNGQDRLEMRLLRKTLCEILGINNLSEATTLFSNEQAKKAAYSRFVEMYANTYGLSELTFEQKEDKIKDAIEIADGKMRSLENPETGIFRQYRSSMGMINEIEAIKNPIDLLLLCFSPKAAKRMRFEARRKLVFMDSAYRSQIVSDSYDRDTDYFIRFLNSRVWQGGLGVVKKVEIVTTHSPIDYSCQDVQVLKPQEKVSLSDYRRYTEFAMRSWIDNKGKKKLVFVEHRRKDPLDLLTKLMRKDTKDPYKIDDYTGLKFVFLNKKDIMAFLNTLQERAREIGSYILFDEIYDTISNPERFRVSNKGSSEKLEIVKVNANVSGVKVEFQMHTLRTYMDSRYKDGVGFEEYSLNRFFDSGVVELTYPSDLYGTGIKKIKDSLIKQRRMAVRQSAIPEIPPGRRKERANYVRYATGDFTRDIKVIIDQLDELPDEIIAVGHSGAVVANALSKSLGVVKVTEYKTEKEIIDLNPRKVLIVHGIVKDGRRIIDLKKRLPFAVVAVIGVKNRGEEIMSLVNYRARDVDKNTWYHYYWEVPELETSLAQGIILFYRVNPSNGRIEYLVEEQRDLEGRNLKFVGGKKKKGENLTETAARELKEETGIDFATFDFRILKDITYDAEIGLNEEQTPIIKKGFSRAFAKKVGEDFAINSAEKGLDKDNIRHIWVSVKEFMERGQWSSQIKGLKEWHDEISKFEKYNTV